MLHAYTPPERFLPYLTWPEIDQMEDKENVVIVLPVGAIEQHGPHLPCSVDATVSAGVVGHALALLPQDIPAYGIPTITYGKSDEHLHFPGTLTLTGELLLHTVQELGESLYRSGFRKLLMVNAHGGQPQPLEMAARELRLRHGDFMVIARDVWSLPHNDDFISEKEKQLSMHAGHGETAIMMALLPDSVHMERSEAHYPEPFPCPTLTNGRPAAAWASIDFGPSGVIGDPSAATLEQGEQLLSDLATQWATAISEIHHAQWVKREYQSWGKSQFNGYVHSQK
ncbi:creatininase family protein [Psychromonas sp. 14N.309.X.WAT.B.A12]|uniref:creatininase family protein n=1 Tax=unclassified Psychromonas TaxID=2614957 RepID=UPI0025AF45A8|nr:creatininase family protein [Psychromonas sp. 14N.309.X.WAT.B.A12]MDN2664508.1 creatininase family protein [Psychromonas sp. 14N.309.X.WAT.B.A12]